MVSVWLAIYTLSILWLIVGIKNYRSKPTRQAPITTAAISVIVPFRNEENNLKGLIACMQQQTVQPHEWIFVNDHSTDNSLEKIYFSEKSISYRIIELSAGEYGKKTAIRKAITTATTDYCLTIDADVTFSVDYIKQLGELPTCDLLVLPVTMKAHRFWQLIFSIEYAITQLLNLGVSGWIRPINCSGANLMFRRNTFLATDDFSTHQHVLSGDDMYTLRAFRKNKKSIHVVSNKSLAVTTSVPNAIPNVLDQRSRWISKSGKVGDSLSNGLAFWAFVLHFSFFLLQIYFLFTQQYLFMGIVFFVKYLMDGFLLVCDPDQTNLRQFIGLLLFELLYPVYLIVLIFWTKSGRVSWKGRVIKQ